MRWRTPEAFKPRLASFLFLLRLGATLASWSLFMVWSTSGWELTSEGIWQSVRRARTEFFLRNSFLCPEQILKLCAKLIHGFKPTSVKTIKTSSEQKLPSKCWNFICAFKFNVPKATSHHWTIWYPLHYQKIKSNHFDNFLQDSCLLTLLHLAALYTL